MNRHLYSPTGGNKGERTARASIIKEKDQTLTLDISKSILDTFAVLVSFPLTNMAHMAQIFLHEETIQSLLSVDMSLKCPYILHCFCLCCSITFTFYIYVISQTLLSRATYTFKRTTKAQGLLIAYTIIAS